MPTKMMHFVGARPRETRNQTCANRVDRDRHDDRDGCGRLLGCESRRVGRRDDHIDPGMNQFGGKIR
jgi:hypothetical protein